MTDRFEDGDPSNNDHGKGEFDPAQGGRFSGGDLKGVEKRLDYISGLGGAKSASDHKIIESISPFTIGATPSK